MAQTDTYDLVVIGGGPGGYVAAVRAAQLGLKTACVDARERLGGVCLNVGCIPSKALLDSSEYYHMALDGLAVHGIKTGRVSLDLKTMLARKNQVVMDLTDNVRKLLEGHKVTIVHGRARLAGEGRVAVSRNGGGTLELSARHILLATGSEPIAPPGIAFDERRIVSSTEALDFEEVPKRLGIVGGGYIGLELGSVWLRLGAEVTVIEMLPKIGTGLDDQVARALDRILRKQGMHLRLGTRVVEAVHDKRGVKVVVEKEDRRETLAFDRLLVSVGRRPLTRDLGLEDAGVRIDPESGHVQVDERYQTDVPGIYAVGDLIAGPALAHKASAEGIAAVETMAGRHGEVNYDAVPAVIYTWPEVAMVGLTEQQARDREVPYCIGTYPFTGAGRARCMGQTDGFVKLIAHAKTDRILGVHIIGPRASDMIAECVLAIELGAASEDIARTIHGHPTFAEALQEAALAVRKCSIYSA